ncbi:tigger transposable element-derived protein 4-like [Schistocerca gregaria]|uniref:tigger transposable element-derived protein 4-like n=1 Tax=Schistocerca gregaria TaxID=7010 RepID=UPI00211E9FCB|nr:tigger transposable element-derived protein 4-like [Schistocerca gregaria]
MAKRKQTAINVQLKLKILDEVDRGTKKTAIAEQFGIPKSTLSTIIKNREKIINAAASGSGNKSKRLRTAKYEDIETLLLEWFNHMRASNIPLTVPVIQSKSNDMAKDMGNEDFRCSADMAIRKFYTLAELRDMVNNFLIQDYGDGDKIEIVGVPSDSLDVVSDAEEFDLDILEDTYPDDVHGRLEVDSSAIPVADTGITPLSENDPNT